MISSVAAMLAGEALFFGSWALALWALLFVLVNQVYFRAIEEPGVEQRFGELPRLQGEPAALVSPNPAQDSLSRPRQAQYFAGRRLIRARFWRIARVGWPRCVPRSGASFFAAVVRLARAVAWTEPACAGWRGPMRRVLVSMAAWQALLGFGPPAQAQHYQPAVPPGAIYGVGCYWFRGHHYCNRYCYLGIDGYYYCQRRLFDAGSQAPPPVVIVPPLSGYRLPRAPYAPRRYGAPPPDRRKAPRPDLR
jgi:hypothetical protein